MNTKNANQINETSNEAFGINLIGNFTGNTGLSVTARAIASLLKSKNIPFSILNVRVNPSDNKKNLIFYEHQVVGINDLKHPINLYVLSIITLQSIFSEHPNLTKQKRFHIANIWWEATNFPEIWLSNLERFDAILTMTNFITEICRNSLNLTPIIHGEHPLDFPKKITRQRSDFNLDNNSVVFLSSLDPNSDPSRKNPGAAIKSFRQAFPVADKNVRLLIRLNNADSMLGQQVAQEMQELAQNDDRITLLLEPLTYTQILSLYACADIYLSFHRSEGLGLGMLESMTLGKPVIATGWSGNLSFMNNCNSALLRYKLIPVHGTFKFFKPEIIGINARWAEPLLEDAIAWMRELRHNTELRENMGRRAKVSALEYQEKAQAAHWLAELHDLWNNHKYLPVATNKLSQIEPNNA